MLVKIARKLVSNKVYFLKKVLIMAFQEIEQNGTLLTANLVAINSTFQGSMGANGDLDYFKIQLSAGGLLTMNFTHPNGVGTTGGNIKLQLSDSDGTVIAYKDFTGSGKLEATVPSGGEYFVTAIEADKFTTTFTAGIYSVETTFVSDSNSAYDGADNNSVATAISLLAGGKISLTPNHVVFGSMGANADVDYFKVQISAGGQLALDFTHPNGVGTAGRNIKVQLSDSSGDVIAFKGFTGSGKLEATVPSAGEYYVTAIEADNFTTTFADGIYSVATPFVSDSNSAYDGADNNSISTAVSMLADGVTPLTPNHVLYGSMGENGDLDYFKLKISAGGQLTMDFTHPSGVGTAGRKIIMQLSDGDGTVITSKGFNGSGKLEATVPTSGNYFVTFIESDNFTTTFAEGVYSVATSFVSDPRSAYDGADNNTIATAISKLADGVTPVTSDHILRGSMGINADVDYFKVQMLAGGPVNLDFTHPNGLGTDGGKITVQLKDSSGNSIASKDFTGSDKLEATVPSSGDYFVTATEADSFTTTFTEGIYSIKIGKLIDETYTGGPGDDKFTGGPGNDTMNGLAGIDTSIYTGPRANFTVTKSVTGFTVTDTKGSDGTDNLITVERLQFADKKIALDLGSNENGGKALEFIGLLAPGLIGTPSVVGTILGIFDGGKSMHDICQFALDLGLVNSLAGSNSNDALAALAFRNVVGFEADASMISNLVGYMDGRFAKYTQADFMTVVAELDLNKAHIGLVGLQQTGIEFV
ncbi:MAG: pre-peptidase C-terminal domain-containing protein [Rhodoferax sp.]|nr:pre-peptidase C-terminal domain-containing protein [Rhodoferax sp.]